MKLSRGVQKAFIALIVSYQLLVMVLTPNSENIFGTRLSPFVYNYASFMDFMSTWGFFAPDPGPPPTFLEWELMDKTGKMISHGNFPDFPNPFFLSDRQMRRESAVRYMLFNPNQAGRMWFSYLCKNNPEANSVRLSLGLYPVPTMEDVITGKKHIGDRTDVSRTNIGLDFCEGKR